MPNISGISLLRDIRANSKLRDQKVAFLTNIDIDNLDEKVDLEEMHPIAYINKPIVIEKFSQDLKKMLK